MNGYEKVKSTSVWMKCRVDRGSVEKSGCERKRSPSMSCPVSHGKKSGLHHWAYGGTIEGCKAEDVLILSVLQKCHLDASIGLAKMFAQVFP